MCPFLEITKHLPIGCFVYGRASKEHRNIIPAEADDSIWLVVLAVFGTTDDRSCVEVIVYALIIRLTYE